MENKRRLKKILITLCLVLCFGLSFLFIGSRKAKAEDLQDYDNSIWYMNYYTDLTTSYVNSLTFTSSKVTSIVQGDGGYTTDALFTMYTGSNMLPQPPASTSIFILVTISHQSTTNTYIWFDFFTAGTTNTSVSNALLRVTFYTANQNSTNSYCRLYNLASPRGADISTLGFYLDKYGLEIVSALVGGSTFSTTILNNDSTATYLFNHCFSNFYKDVDNYERGYNIGYNNAMNEVGGSLDTYYNNGYNAGYTAGASSINTSSYYNNGYNAGYTAGLTNSSQDYGISDLLFSVLNVPIAVLTNLFSINIFGANVLAVIVSLLIVTISVWVIKKLIFGKGD